MTEQELLNKILNNEELSEEELVEADKMIIRNVYSGDIKKGVKND